jgi:hypothetical protein
MGIVWVARDTAIKFADDDATIKSGVIETNFTGVVTDELRVPSAPSNIEAKVLAIPPPELLQGLRELRVIRLVLRVSRFVIHKYADTAHCSCLLRVRSERPHDHRAAQQRDELAPSDVN